ncbi:homeobox protein BEL1 homolog [Typha latifolia]|uniref:homeobox protein BEL1 homolog n=1 Tax=Typha latifolia TaxID=4733 RepID=UPI003C2B5899
MMAHESHLAEFPSSGHHPAMQGFEPGHEIFGLQAGMEMLGFPSKQQRGFLPRDFSEIPNKNVIVATESSAISPWHVDDAVSRPLFSNTGGLSLSLSNTRASNAYGFPQSFQQNNTRDGLLSRASNSHQEHLLMEEGRGFYQQQYTYQLRNSKYLIPVQELLSELCNLGGGENSSKITHKGNQAGSSSSSSWNQSLSSMNVLELQKRKADLFTMLTEVDKRYRKYCQQMKAVVSSFEVVAGGGAAAIYSNLASRAMSRHFRCLRDAIADQIRETKKALGTKDTVVTGATRGETPRLKMLDQCLRQQKVFQQTGMTESHPWRPQRGLPERAVSVLRAWLFEHFLHPYPSDVDKHILARQTGLSRSQVSNWFINARVRLWKPMIEEMYSEEIKDHYDNHQSEHQGSTNKNPNPNSNPAFEKKPAPAQLSANCDSLSSIINSGSNINNKNIHNVQRTDNFGAVADMDFPSYRTTTYDDRNLGGSGFLSLGLQQNGGGGMSLSYAPPSQNSFLVSGEHLDGGQSAQFSILDGEEQTLPYRNLMGVQLLHDLAG